MLLFFGFWVLCGLVFLGFFFEKMGRRALGLFGSIFCGTLPTPGVAGSSLAAQCPRGSAQVQGSALGQWGAGLCPQHVPAGSFSSITALSCLDYLLLQN